MTHVLTMRNGSSFTEEQKGHKQPGDSMGKGLEVRAAAVFKRAPWALPEEGSWRG